MLIYGAFNPANRRFALVIAGTSKVVFILLILVFGAQYLSRAGLALAVDSILICLFAIYLVSTRGTSSSA